MQSDVEGTWKLDGELWQIRFTHWSLQWFGGKIDFVSGVILLKLSKIQTEDTAVGIVKFKNGAVGTLEVTTGARPKTLKVQFLY